MSDLKTVKQHKADTEWAMINGPQVLAAIYCRNTKSIAVNALRPTHALTDRPV